MRKVRVGINGYGTIGRRVADAVLKQDDMVLVGVTKKSPDFRCAEAKEKEIDVYGLGDGKAFLEFGYESAGSLECLLKKVDVIIDCAPKKVGKKNLEIYGKFPDLKVVFQGGESDEVSEVSFNSESNYDQARGKKFVRVVSCNTTAMCRVISQLKKKYELKKVRVAVVRRCFDPGASRRKGPVNAWEPSMGYPSHHAIDVNRVIPDVKISSLAGIAPMTIMHGHMMFVQFERAPVSAKEVLDHLSSNPRIRVVSSADGFGSTAQIKDYAVVSGRGGDTYEVCVWKESVSIDSDGEVGMHLAIDQQADVIPENVDAVRAMFGMMNSEDSMAATNKSLGMG